MMAQEKHIKQIILETLSSLSVLVSNVILFGSRARKDFKEDSDWDLLIVLDDTVTREVKKEIAHLIRRNLAQENILSDVIIKKKEEIKDLKHRKFSIVRSAFEEGVPI